MPESPIRIRDLLAPTASGVLNQGTVFKDDRRLSLWLFAQDAFGWQNWLKTRQVPFADNANEMLYEAGERLLFSSAETDQVLATARIDQAIPACVYKGDEDESIDFNGDVIAWAHLFNLQPSLAAYCPPEIRTTVSDHIDQHRQHFPKERATQPARGETWHSEKPASTTAADVWKVDEPIVDGPLPKAEILETANEPDLSKAESTTQLDTNLAQLGREIVARIGEEQDGQRSVNGKVKYRISISLADNTMRIYARDRGEEPILVDANGNIDHANSQVLPEDVRRFQVMVDDLRAYQQPTGPKKTAQLDDWGC